MMRRVLTPISRAARRLAAVAITALPSKVRSMNSHSRMTMTAAPVSTTRLCGRMAAPPNLIGSLPNSGGRLWKRLSKTICATPRRNTEAPMVIMISATGLAPRAGSMAKRCSARPTPVVTAMAISAASGRGTPASASKDGCHAAQHDELALGEIDDVGGVVDQREAERDQRVDGAHGQPREDELQQLGHRGEGLSGLGFDRSRTGRASSREPARPLSQVPGTSVQSPLLISSMWNADRSSPMWSVGDMFTMPPVPM